MTLKFRAAWLLLLAAVIAVPAGIYFAGKAGRTYQVLAHSQNLEAPEIANLRGWMTVAYIADTFDMPASVVLKAVGLPEDGDTSATLRDIAETDGADPLDLVYRVQTAIAEHLQRDAPDSPNASESGDGWLERLTDQSLSAFLKYGYPALIVILFVGALGLPVPAGPMAAVAGSLAALGEIDWLLAAGLAVASSVTGDIAGYTVGRWLSPAALTRYGRWIGYTPANKERLQKLYDQWGGLTLILTRSLVAYIGAVASLLAGAGHYPLSKFVLYSVAGRLIWTVSYFGLGFVGGNDIAAASGFLGYLSMLLIAVALFFVSLTLFVRRLNA